MSPGQEVAVRARALERAIVAAIRRPASSLSRRSASRTAAAPASWLRPVDAQRPTALRRDALEQQAQRAAVARERSRRERRGELHAPGDLLAALGARRGLDLQRASATARHPPSRRRSHGRESRDRSDARDQTRNLTRKLLPRSAARACRRRSCARPHRPPRPRTGACARRRSRRAAPEPTQRAPCGAAATCLTHTSKPTVALPGSSRGYASIAAVRSIIAIIPGVESTDARSVPATSVSSWPSTSNSVVFSMPTSSESPIWRRNHTLARRGYRSGLHRRRHRRARLRPRAEARAGGRSRRDRLARPGPRRGGGARAAARSRTGAFTGLENQAAVQRGRDRDPERPVPQPVREPHEPQGRARPPASC